MKMMSGRDAVETLGLDLPRFLENLAIRLMLELGLTTVFIVQLKDALPGGFGGRKKK
jgi:hypothetical protein